MIIDGKLVVSKKKKQVLIEELKAKGFKPVPKVKDKIKEGELAPMADDDAEEDEGEYDVGAASYDYLLGMPIWSLTKERVEKLQKQMGDVELAIDELIKLSKEDLWKRDLEEFIEEWRFQLADEHKRQRKVTNMGRRASTKIRVGAAAGRKRKGHESDDSDFDGAPKTKKSTVPKSKGGILGDYLGVTATKPAATQKAKGPSAAAQKAQKVLQLFDNDLQPASKPKDEEDDDIWMQVDGPSASAPYVAKEKPKAPMTKTTIAKPPRPPIAQALQDTDEEVVRPQASRKPRAAATKPVKYNALSDSDSDGEDMLFNVGSMVKGIETNKTSSDASRPLFAASASRPSSSHGIPKKPSSSAKQILDVDADDTDYSKLVPPTTKKGPAVTARQLIVSDDDDSLGELPAKKLSKPKVDRPVQDVKKPKPVTSKKGAAPSAASLPKQHVLSPAGKAYAAKKAKAEKAAQKAQEEEFEDDIANDVLNDDEDEASAPRRPARRTAAAAPKKKYLLSDDEDSAVDEDEATDDFEDSEL